VWTLRKDEHEAAIDVKAVPGVGAEIVLTVERRYGCRLIRLPGLHWARARVSGGLSVGGSINDRWLLGANTTGWAKYIDDELLTVGTLDFRFRFDPARTQGFFITAGLGVGNTSFAGRLRIWCGRDGWPWVGSPSRPQRQPDAVL